MQLEIGAIYTGKVTGVTKFGAFIELQPGTVGMVHISEIANTYVEQVSDYLKVGQEVKVKLLTINEGNKLGLSIKKAETPAPRPMKAAPPPPEPVDKFEAMMDRFKKSSEEKMTDLRRSADGKRSGGYAPRKR